MHEQKRESGGRVVHHERRLLAIQVKTRSGVRQFTIGDGLAASKAALESDRVLEPVSGVIVTTPGSAVDDADADWGFGDLSAGSSGGGEQQPAVMSSIRDCVGQLGLWVPKMWTGCVDTVQGGSSFAFGIGGRACDADDHGG